MAYESRRPRARDLLQNSQLDFLNNYQAIDAFIAADHFPFNDAGGRDGKHKFMRFQLDQPAQLPPLNNRNYLMLYRRAYTQAPFRTSLFIKRPGINVDYPYNLQISEESIFGNPTGNHGFYCLGNNVYALFFRHSISGPLGQNTYILDLEYPTSPNQPPFQNVFTVMIQTQNTGFTNDDNADVQVAALNLDRIIVRVAMRSNNGILAPTGVGYFTIIGQI